MTPQPTQHVMRLRRMFHISHADVRTCSRGRKPGSACALPTTRTDSRHAATIIRKQVRTRSPLNSRPRTAKTAGNARQAAKTSAASIPTGPRSGNPVQSTPGQKKKKENVKWLHVALTLTQHVLCAPVFRIERSNITFSLLCKEGGNRCSKFPPSRRRPSITRTRLRLRLPRLHQFMYNLNTLTTRR